MISNKHIKKYCSEDPARIENYNEAVADTTQVWDCHHRAEILPCGRFSIEDLQKYGLYYNRPASELIFLPHSAHYSMHLMGNSYTKGAPAWNKGLGGTGVCKAWNKGIPCSEDTKLKISETKTGRRLSEAHKKAISDGCRGSKHPNYGKHLLEETKKKISAKKTEANTGCVWCNDGVHSKFVRVDEVPEGWKRGRISGMQRWYNNGVKNVRAKECPEGFVAGRVKTNG